MPDASPQKSMEVLMAEMRAEQEAERKAAGGMTVDDEGEMSDDSIMAKYRDDTDDEILRPDGECIRSHGSFSSNAHNSAIVNRRGDRPKHSLSLLLSFLAQLPFITSGTS